MTEESESRKKEGEEVGEVTDEESAELWLVEKKGKNTESGRRGGNAAFISGRWQGVCACLCVSVRVGVCGGGRGAQFVNAITVDLPSLTTESNQHHGGDSSA